MSSVFLVLILFSITAVYSVVIDCTTGVCDGTTVQCISGESCTVDCSHYGKADGPCNSPTIIDANNATDLTVQCITDEGFDVCYGLTISCGTANNCGVHCACVGDCDGKTFCEDLYLYCSGECTLQCDNDDNEACVNADVDITNAHSFECTGEFCSASNAPPPFTAQPTAIPSTQPTTLPTTQPTLIPTVQPTLLPTTEPTIVPTSLPTSYPTTSNPSQHPTTTAPTVSPTTNIPTLSPSNPITTTYSPTGQLIITTMQLQTTSKNEKEITETAADTITLITTKIQSNDNDNFKSKSKSNTKSIIIIALSVIIGILIIGSLMYIIIRRKVNKKLKNETITSTSNMHHDIDGNKYNNTMISTDDNIIGMIDLQKKEKQNVVTHIFDDDDDEGNGDDNVFLNDNDNGINVYNNDNITAAGYRWIELALIKCDDTGYEQYLNNFKKHKMNEKRLKNVIDDNDGVWEELIPEIGIRLQFQSLWNSYNDDGVQHIKEGDYNNIDLIQQPHVTPQRNTRKEPESDDSQSIIDDHPTTQN